MTLIYFCAILFTLSIASDVASSTTILGRMTQDSHPMLASVFHVADKIRRLHGKSDDQISNGPRIGNNRHQIGKITADNGIRKEKEIVKFVTQSIPVKDKRVDTFQNINVGGTQLQGLDKEILNNPAVLQNAGLQSGVAPIQKPMSALFPGMKTFPESGALPNRVSETSVIGISADMWCSLCQRQGNITCIAMHCFNDRNTGTVFESQPSRLLPETAQGAVPLLPNNFDFSSQIDRHDLLQLTNPQLATNQNADQRNSNTISANVPGQTTGNSIKENTAPIWMLSDSLRETSPTFSPLWSMTDNTNVVPATLKEPTSHIAGHNMPASDRTPIEVHHPNQEIAFVEGNLLPLVPDVRPSPAVRDPSGHVLDNNAPTDNGEIYLPLNISTDILRQLVSLESPSFAITSETAANENIPVNALNENANHDVAFLDTRSANGNGVNTIGTNNNPQIAVARDVFANVNHESSSPRFNFPDGFVEGSTSVHDTDSHSVQSASQIPTASNVFANVNHESSSPRFNFPDGFVEGSSGVQDTDTHSVRSAPQIPTANDVFSNVRNVMETDNRHTLVIKDHGATEVLGVHIGSVPILGSNIRPLEMDVQNAIQQPPNNQVVNSHTFAELGHQHSQESSHDHHRPIADKHTQRIPLTEVRQELSVIDNVGHNGVAVQTFTTTTPVPTIDPERRAVLQNWSKELLQGIHV